MTTRTEPFKVQGKIVALPRSSTMTESGVGLVVQLLRITSHLTFQLAHTANQTTDETNTEAEAIRTHAQSLVFNPAILSSKGNELIVAYQEAISAYCDEFASFSPIERTGFCTEMLNATAGVAAALDVELAGIPAPDIGWSI